MILKQWLKKLSQLIKETFRQYRSQKVFRSLAKEAKTAVKKKGLTAKDLSIK